MRKSPVTTLERRALVAMLSQIKTQKAAEDAVEMLEVSKREIDGAGFITEFRPITDDAHSANAAMEMTLVGDHPRLSEGAIFTLFYSPSGSIESLEGATFAGESWPDDDEWFQFHGA